MFIINPLSGERMDNLFSTHPDTQNRIAALQAMAGEFATASTPGFSAARPTRRARTVPTTGSAHPHDEPRKGPWS